MGNRMKKEGRKELSVLLPCPVFSYSVVCHCANDAPLRSPLYTPLGCKGRGQEGMRERMRKGAREELELSG